MQIWHSVCAHVSLVNVLSRACLHIYYAKYWTVAAGHSFGGATAIQSTIQDPRFTGCIALDAWMLPLSKVCRVNFHILDNANLSNGYFTTDPVHRVAAFIHKVHPKRCQKHCSVQGLVVFVGANVTSNSGIEAVCRHSLSRTLFPTSCQ